MRILALVITLITFTYTNHINWLGDYNKALAKAQKEKKPLMVLLVKKECKSCNDIIVKYFMNQDYIDRFNKKFVSVIVNYNQKSSYPIELYYSSSFPTLFLINSENESFLIEPIYKYGFSISKLSAIK